MAGSSKVRAGEAYVELGTRDDALQRGLKAAQARLRAFAASVNAAGDSMIAAGTKVGAIGAAMASPFVVAVKMFASAGDELAKASARTGVAVEEIGALKYAAEQSGAGLAEMEIGLRRMSALMLDAAGGSRSANETLARLGLTLADLQGLAPDRQFRVLADRIAAIDHPTTKAALAMDVFGRSGTRLLPLIKDGAAGIDQLTDRYRQLGLEISSADASSAEKFGDILSDLWKQLSQVGIVAGATIAQALQPLAEKATVVLAAVIEWTRANPGLVTTLAAVAAGVVALGGVMVGLGVALKIATGFISAAASIVGVLQVAIATLFSPIGLAIAAVVGLGVALVKYTAAGGEALRWLQDRFGELAGFVGDTVAAIGNALAAGDIALAAQVLWASLRVAWERGTLELRKAWETFKGAFIKTAYGAFYGALAAWETVQHGLTVGWIETTAFLGRTWTRFTSLLRSTWEGTQNWLEGKWHDLFALFDSSYDAEGAKAMANRLSQQKQADIEAEKQKRLADNERELAAQRQAAARQHEEEMARIGGEANDAFARVDAEGQRKIASAQQEFDQALAAWQDATRRAAEARPGEMAAGGPTAPQLPDDFDFDPTALADAAGAKAGGTARGTFNAFAAGSLDDGRIDRIAKASERSAESLRRIEREITSGDGLTF